MVDLHCSNSGRKESLKRSLLPLSSSFARVSAGTFLSEALRKHEQKLSAWLDVKLVRSPKRLTHVSLNVLGLTERSQPLMQRKAKRVKKQTRTFFFP